jgi:F420-dependent oxidoreductase-like protein
VWRRERVEHSGASYQIPVPEGKGTGLGKPLKIINHPVRSEIPIYVASLGPKNVEMTAEKADGWLPIFYLPEKAKDVWGADLASGAAKRSADLGPMEIVAGGLLSVGDGAEAVREFSRPMAALYIGGMGAKGRNFYNDLVTRYGYEQEAEQIQDLYLDGKKDEAAKLVPDELLEGTSLCGSEGYVRERLAAYKESGVTVLNVTPIGPDPVKLIEQVKGWIEDL